MDTRRSISESFVRFLEFKGNFNQQFKVGVAALVHVASIVDGIGGNRVMQGLVANTGEPWSDFNWRKPSRTLKECLAGTTLLGVVQVHAAIDDYCEAIASDQTRWLHFTKAPPSTPGPEDPAAEQLEGTCARLGWPCQEFSQWRPVLRYFRLVRNCVAHRSGLASKALSEVASSGELAGALGGWAKRSGAEPPMLPRFDDGEVISLLPRHAILSIDAAYRAADCINKKFVRSVGPVGMCYLAAHHSLLQGRVSAVAHRSADAVINEALANRYRVRGSSADGTIATLKALGVWRDCLKAFKDRSAGR